MEIHRKFVLVPKCLYFQSKIILCFLVLKLWEKSNDYMERSWTVDNELKFDPKIGINRLHLCAKFQFLNHQNLDSVQGLEKLFTFSFIIIYYIFHFIKLPWQKAKIKKLTNTLEPLNKKLFFRKQMLFLRYIIFI